MIEWGENFKAFQMTKGVRIKANLVLFDLIGKSESRDNVECNVIRLNFSLASSALTLFGTVLIFFHR